MGFTRTLSAQAHQRGGGGGGGGGGREKSIPIYLSQVPFKGNK